MMKALVISLTLLSLISLPVSAQEQTDGLEAIVQPQQFRPIPDATSSFWRDSIPEPMRRSYIRYGEQYLGQPWISLPFTLFAEFKNNGNRTRYEAINFEKRKQLAALALAEIIEGEGRFLNDIANGLGSFCEETWWGIPAHYGKECPVPEDQSVDLFNAETAGLIAWIRYMLQTPLDRFSPLLCQQVDREINRRILQPALKGNYWWKSAGMNWNPWICSNWLTCILICEKEREQQLEGVRQVMQAMEAFTQAYPNDGGCDEGTGYWDRAAASLFECIRLLDLATEHRINRVTPKIREMMNYIHKMYIGNGYCVNFADAHDNRMQAQPDIVLPIALYFDDPTMKGFAAHIARENHLFEEPAELYKRSGNFPTLGRELFMLKEIAAIRRMQAKEPQQKETWLPDLQILTAREGDLYIAVKGGHNGENHNHNDAGNFILYASGEPLIIDVGVGEYTSKTFSRERYSIWTMQSQYHNLPLINGIGQKDGKTYASKVIAKKNRMLTLEIAGAYPEDAAVKSWKRTVQLQKGVVEISESYQLEGYQAPTQLMFLTTTRPNLSETGTVHLGEHALKFDPQQLEPSFEDISDKLDPLLQGIWGKQLYRIILTVRSTKLKGQIRYRIQ